MSLMGEFDVMCMNCNKIDRVHGVTLKHHCSGCGDKSVHSGAGVVTCSNPTCNARDLVAGLTFHHNCSSCGTEAKHSSDRAGQ